MERKNFENLDQHQEQSSGQEEIKEMEKVLASEIEAIESGQGDDGTEKQRGKHLGFLATTFGAVVLNFLNVSGDRAQAADFSWDRLLNQGVQSAERIIVEQQRAEQRRRELEARREQDRIREEARRANKETDVSGRVAIEEIRRKKETDRDRLKSGKQIPSERESEISGPFGDIKLKESEGATNSPREKSAEKAKPQVQSELSPEAREALRNSGRGQAEKDYRRNARLYVKADAHPVWTEGYVIRWMELEKEKSPTGIPTKPGQY